MKLMRHDDYVVRVPATGRSDRVSPVGKSFKSEDARARWIDVHDHKIVKVLAFSDPQWSSRFLAATVDTSMRVG